jgi:hypothetical protein
MAAYVVPQVVVYQEFQQAAAGVTVVLPAFIFGPNYQLFRYGVADEKIKSAIGAYDYAVGNTAVWPNKTAGAVVDQAWTSLFMDTAWLKYYEEFAGGGVSIKGYVNPTTNRAYRNRITSDSLIFASYGEWARSAAFKNRDVKAGDGVILKATVLGEEYTVTTKVSRLINDVIAADISAPTVDSHNAGATSASITEVPVSGSLTDVTGVYSGTYDGIADGYTSESYVLTVTTAGGFGAARFSVVSGSGTDTPVDPLVPLDGTAVDIGTRGLKVTFSTSGSAPHFSTGYVMRINVVQAWTPAVAADSGTYTGANDGTYIVEVTKGGLWAAVPHVFVSSTGTLDASGPYEVENATYITLPTGVKVKLTGAGLVKGDRYYIEVASESAGAIHTLELTNSLPLELFQVFSESDSPDPVDLDCSISIIKNIEVLRTRSGVIPNWSTSVTEISVEPAILGTDSTWVDNLGNLLEIPVIKGTMYVQYRALLQVYVNTFGSVTNTGEVEGLLGPAVEDNPLSLGVMKAVTNSNGLPVGFMATGGGADDSAAFSAVLEKIYDRTDVYGLVPLTHNKAIQDMVLGHCLDASSPLRGRWRVCWFAAQITEQSAVEQTDSDGNMLLCTVLDDPETSGTQYTYLNCDAANFITAGVLAGQTVRTNYVVNPATGVEEYDEFVIDSVVSEEYLRLATGPSAPINIPTRFEVWKDNTTDDMALQVTTLAGSFGSRRAHVILPDKIGDGGTLMDGMFACCALAGLRSGVYPHQGLTNAQLFGFDDCSRVTRLFGGRQLNTMAGAGVWIITQDNTGLVYTRHQLTTDMTDINTREDSMVSNIDSLSYYYLFFFQNARYIGRRNITPALLTQLAADFDGASTGIISQGSRTTLGPQMLSATLVKLERHPTLLDRIVAQVNVDLPEPLNNLDITLFVLAQ